MILKSLMLVMVFIPALEINTSIAKNKSYKCPCECIESVSEAVDEVMASSHCDLCGVWEAPNDLEDQFENLQSWCNSTDRPSKVKAPDIIEEMLETIHKTIVGESKTTNGETTVITEPAPDCAIEALLNLQTLLLYGCPKQTIK